MDSKDRQSRRDFLRHAVMLAGAGVTAPLWAAMKYDRNAVLRYFRAGAAATDARVKAGIEANRKGDAPGGRLSFRGFCGTYEVEATSNGRTVKRQFHVGNASSAPIEISFASGRVPQFARAKCERTY